MNQKNSKSPHPSLLIRLWLAPPDWAYRAIGAVCFFAYFAWRLSDYLRFGFWHAGAYKQISTHSTLYLPYGRILVELTFLLIALSFCFRLPPRARAARPAEILLPILAAFWPFLPLVALPLIGLHSQAARSSFESLLFDRQMSLMRFIAGSVLIIAGNSVDVWGYAVLFRSFSIAAEARMLKTKGPYRWVRHPIYFGQFLAQAGVWLCYPVPRWEFRIFYAVFIALQLYRSRIEDDVLERHFGDAYRDWKRQTRWFV